MAAALAASLSWQVVFFAWLFRLFWWLCRLGLLDCFAGLDCSAALPASPARQLCRSVLLCSFAGQSCCNPDSKIAIFRHSTTPQFFCCATVGGSFRRESPDMQLFLAQHTVSAVKSAETRLFGARTMFSDVKSPVTRLAGPSSRMCHSVGGWHLLGGRALLT